MKFSLAAIWQNRPVRIGIYYFLLTPVIMALSMHFGMSTDAIIGGPAVLEFKPYANVFLSATELRDQRNSIRPLILFLGDSSVAMPPWAKKGSPHIPALLEDELREAYAGSANPRVIDWSFLAARPYHYYCLLFEAEKHLPDLMIMPINWRILSLKIEEPADERFFSELCALIPLTERLHPAGRNVLSIEGLSASQQFSRLSVWPDLFRTTIRAYFRTKIGIDSDSSSIPKNRQRESLNFQLFFAQNNKPKDLATIDDGDEELIQDNEDDRDRIIEQLRAVVAHWSEEELFEHYNNNISTDNGQLRTLNLLMQTAARLKIKTLFYIAPIHIEELRKRKRFNPADFQASVDRIVESTTSETSMCLNLSDLLHESDFIDCFEHYTAEGNQKIAESLLPAVCKLVAQDTETSISRSLESDGHTR